MRIARRAALGLSLALLPSAGARAQAYPARPVTVIVPQAPGGTNDIVARLIADKLGEGLGQRFLVENRAGAGGNIGTAAAAKASQDGHTLLVTISSSQAINPALYKSTGFDPVADFEPITLLAAVPNVLVVHPSLPATSVAELIELARRSPGSLQYASAGNGTLNHLLAEMLKSRAGLDMVHVPYRGVAPALNDIVAGHMKLGFASMPSVIAQIQGGTLRALGVSTLRRSPAAPEIPAIAETLPGFGADLWVGLFAVRGTPREVTQRLLTEAHRALADPEVRRKLAAQGAEIVTSSPDELAAILRDDLAKWAEIVRTANVRIE